MHIYCPACSTSAEIDQTQMPFGTLVAKCPKCGCEFSFRRSEEFQQAAEEVKKLPPKS